MVEFSCTPGHVFRFVLEWRSILGRIADFLECQACCVAVGGDIDIDLQSLSTGSGVPWLQGQAVVAYDSAVEVIPAGIPLPQWFGLLVVGFLFGVFYMKGKYDGRVVA